MPTYGYRCKECKHQFEIIQRITDDPIKTCPECGKEVSKMIYPVGIVFKGSGFHVNDYSSTGRATSTGTTNTNLETTPSEIKTDVKPETKTETKAETKTDSKPEVKTEAAAAK